MNTSNVIKRVTLYLVILFIGIILIMQLSYFIPGFLLAITLYILLRRLFFNLTITRGWKKWIAALTLIFTTLLILALPIWVVVEILIPKIEYLITNSDVLMSKATSVLTELKQSFPQITISDEDVQSAIRSAATYAPQILGTTAHVITNLATGFFIVYFMFLGGKNMERGLHNFLPLKEASKDDIWKETHKLVISNAVGIPILAMLQAIIAIIGYWIFGVDQFIIWGLMTGICSLIPVVGTMIVWVPIVGYLFAIDQTGYAIGLALYSAIVISNADNVLRFTIMKRLGEIHPLITVFGVLAGLNLFGIMGLIFGPLLISYFILLIKVYRAEFTD